MRARKKASRKQIITVRALSRARSFLIVSRYSGPYTTPQRIEYGNTTYRTLSGSMEPSLGLQQEQGQNPIPLCTANGARRRIPLYECHVSQVHKFGEQLPALFPFNNFILDLSLSLSNINPKISPTYSSFMYAQPHPSPYTPPVVLQPPPAPPVLQPTAAAFARPLDMRYYLNEMAIEQVWRGGGMKVIWGRESCYTIRAGR